jgi:hypothetical protein
MRVRTGRFDGLRLLGKAGNSQLVEERVGQREMKTVCRRVPPSSAVGSHAPGGAVCHAAGDHRPIDDGAAFAVLELHRTQAVANPLVEVRKDARGLGEPEVSLPSVEIGSEPLADLREALPGGARVIARTRSFRRSMACGARRRRTVRPGATRKEKPRNFVVVARATLLLLSLIRSLRRPKSLRSDAITLGACPSIRRIFLAKEARVRF